MTENGGVGAVVTDITKRKVTTGVHSFRIRRLRVSEEQKIARLYF